MSFVRIAHFISIQLAIIVLALLMTKASLADDMPDLYFVDAHSQMAKGLSSDKIIPLMDKAGVRHTILSARNDRSPQDVADFAARHPDRITAAVRSKGRGFNLNKPNFQELINTQVSQPVFKAMAEAILYHAQKGRKAPEINVAIDSPQSRVLLDIALRKNWPYIAHYEFRAAKNRKETFLASFKKMARNHSGHPFVLIHMGQLYAADVGQLIADHRNVYFMMSHSNPVSIAKNPGQPWANLFSGKKLADNWKALMLEHPDRFILTFDNVWPQDWGKSYLKQAALWRKALSTLPLDVAHALAHGNAERLWRLPVP